MQLLRFILAAESAAPGLCGSKRERKRRRYRRGDENRDEVAGARQGRQDCRRGLGHRDS
ncbi:hypothetical protein M404DRAFT_1008762, partial [Pisolithus tinctorius Marx 270]